MASSVDVKGVHTWYNAHGEGEPLVLLHPGLTDLVADDTPDFLEKVVGGSARVLGCSDGAIVGPDNHPVTQERHRPDEFEIGPVNLSTRRCF